MEEKRVTNSEENLIDLFEIIGGLFKSMRRFWWLLLLILCLCTAGNVFRAKVQYKARYEATAAFAVTTGGKEYSSISNYYNKVTMEQLNTTFPYIITSGVLSNIVAEDLGLSNIPASITATVLEETNLFQIRVIASEAQLAYDILQSVIENYPSVAKYVIGDTTLTLIDETGVPEAPMYGPGYKGAAVKGFLIGVILCCVILFIQVMLSSTVKTQEDLKKFLNIKYLAGIPQERVKKRSKGNSKHVMLDKETVSPTFRESMNTLQIRVARAMEEKQIKTLVVTSTLAGEGKTTISSNLAYAMAEKGYKTLLIDGDFRNPSVAAALNLPESEYGISDVLKGKISAGEVIRQYGDSILWVLPGKEPQEKVSKLYRNGRLQNLIQKYSRQMDIIIIDTPPCGMMNDAALAADCAEGILLVIRQDYARREKILEGVEMLDSSNASLIGCVINDEEVNRGGYGRYGYGRYGYGKYGKYGYGKYGYGAGTRK